MYQTLYRKYRPTNFDDVVGEEHITKILKNELKSGKISHAYLFTGPRGTGKTSCAKILAKAVNCQNSTIGDACCQCEICKGMENGDILDVLEIDAASNNSVENIRDLREQVTYTPTTCKYRVYIIDEVHMLSSNAFNALLKTLEEPPPHIIFILATTEVHKLPATILSRCQRFDFHRISNEAIINRIQYIAEKEGFKIEDNAAQLIAALSDGGMRDALSTLDLCAARSNHITQDDVMQVCSLAGDNYCLQLSEYIKTGNIGDALNKIDELHKNAIDLQHLCSELVEHYRNLMILKTVKSPEKLIVKPSKELENLKKVSEEYSLESIIHAISILSEALERMATVNRRTEFEMSIIKLCTPSLDSSPSALLDRLEKIERTIKYQDFSVKPLDVSEQSLPSEEQIETEKVPVDKTADLDLQYITENEAIASEKPSKPTDINLEPNGPVTFDAWQDVITELTKTAPLISASLNNSTAYVSGDLLLIDCENDQFFSLMRNENPIYRTQIKKAVQAVVGKSYRLGPYKKETPSLNDPLQNIINKLKSLEVPGAEN